MSPEMEARVAQARRTLCALENDVRLLPAEVERVAFETLGALRPRTLGQARRLIDALRSTLANVTTEIPF